MVASMVVDSHGKFRGFLVCDSKEELLKIAKANNYILRGKKFHTKNPNIINRCLLCGYAIRINQVHICK